MSATKTKVQSIIDENPVAVFSKSYCPYCRQAKQLLSDKGAKFYAIELDQVGTYTCYKSFATRRERDQCCCARPSRVVLQNEKRLTFCR